MPISKRCGHLEHFVSFMVRFIACLTKRGFILFSELFLSIFSVHRTSFFRKRARSFFLYTFSVELSLLRISFKKIFRHYKPWDCVRTYFLKMSFWKRSQVHAISLEFSWEGKFSHFLLCLKFFRPSWILKFANFGKIISKKTEKKNYWFKFFN